MEPKRYWWISYGNSRWSREMCADIHPFLWVADYNKNLQHHQSTAGILNYRLVDVTEYNLWHEINGDK